MRNVLIVLLLAVICTFVGCEYRQEVFSTNEMISIKAHLAHQFAANEYINVSPQVGGENDNLQLVQLFRRRWSNNYNYSNDCPGGVCPPQMRGYNIVVPQRQATIIQETIVPETETEHIISPTEESETTNGTVSDTPKAETPNQVVTQSYGSVGSNIGAYKTRVYTYSAPVMRSYGSMGSNMGNYGSMGSNSGNYSNYGSAGGYGNNYQRRPVLFPRLRGW